MGSRVASDILTRIAVGKGQEEDWRAAAIGNQCARVDVRAGPHSLQAGDRPAHSHEDAF
jgi:hypothetical protein